MCNFFHVIVKFLVWNNERRVGRCNGSRCAPTRQRRENDHNNKLSFECRWRRDIRLRRGAVKKNGLAAVGLGGWRGRCREIERTVVSRRKQRYCCRVFSRRCRRCGLAALSWSVWERYCWEYARVRGNGMILVGTRRRVLSLWFRRLRITLFVRRVGNCLFRSGQRK